MNLELARDFRGELLFRLGDLGRRRSQLRQNILDAIGLEDLDGKADADELGLAHVRHQREQWLPEIVDIASSTGLA